MSDLLLGARLAFVGGRDGRTRTALTALGVGIGVALLLLAAAVPGALQARSVRAEARNAVSAQETLRSSADTLLIASADTLFRGRAVRGWVVRPEGPRAPLPPGVTSLPAAGQVLVSPALARVLESPDGRLLAPRLGGARVAGTIAEAGLTGPGELAFYLGSDTLVEDAATRVDRFGGSAQSGEDMGPMLTVLVSLIFVVLLLPIAVFLGAAMRFGGERRDRRLAALRLIGADAQMTRRIATGEATVGALLGILAGGVIFALGRQLVPLVTIADLSVFATDVRPRWSLVVAIVVAVPATAVVVGLVALRGVVVEPLGVVRQATTVRRRLWWRLALPLAGLGLLYPLVGNGVHSGFDDYYHYAVALGAALLLVGVVALLPWLIELTVRRLRGGPVPWQLAIRRLQLDSATSARLVSGMAVAVAGTIGLQMLFVTIQEEYTVRRNVDAVRHQAYVETYPGVDPAAALARISAAPGVTAGSSGLIANALRWQPAAPGATTDQVPMVALWIGDCASLAYFVAFDRCADGDVFLPDYGHAKPGADSAMVGPGVGLSSRDATFQWKVPAGVRMAKIRDTFTWRQGHLLVTPGAIDTARLGPMRTTVAATLDPRAPDAVEHLRNAAAAIDPLSSIDTPTAVVEARSFVNVRRGLYVGVVVTLLVIGASLLVAVLEQLRERRRLLAMLVAVGTRRRSLTWSVLWQLAVPVAIGMALATVVGLGLGLVLQRLVGVPMHMDWTVVGLSTGLAAAAVLVVNGLSLPALWRLMRPDGLRTE